MEITPPIKKEGPELGIQGTPTNYCDYTLSDKTCQLPLGTKEWEGTDHPYYQLDDLIEEAQCMLDRRRKRKTVVNFLQRIITLLPWISARVRGGTPRRLLGVLVSLRVAAEVLEDSFLTPKAAAEKTDQILEEARQMLGKLMVADEDAKFPGCRDDEGFFLEDKAREALNER